MTEADMERQLFQATSDVTVNEILKRYAQQILPTHRNGAISEHYRLQRLKCETRKLPLSQLTPMSCTIPTKTAESSLLPPRSTRHSSRQKVVCTLEHLLTVLRIMCRSLFSEFGSFDYTREVV